MFDTRRGAVYSSNSCIKRVGCYRALILNFGRQSRFFFTYAWNNTFIWYIVFVCYSRAMNRLFEPKREHWNMCKTKYVMLFCISYTVWKSFVLFRIVSLFVERTPRVYTKRNTIHFYDLFIVCFVLKVYKKKKERRRRLDFIR